MSRILSLHEEIALLLSIFFVGYSLVFILIEVLADFVIGLAEKTNKMGRAMSDLAEMLASAKAQGYKEGRADGYNQALDKVDDIITEQLDKSDNQVECQTLRWVLDVISDLIQ